ncbi:MAG: hypothetical protein IJJ22_01190 [Oscillospiraceae bacterium]|nr:hypothetical protein [Oscillospiraceae bacterium]
MQLDFHYYATYCAAVIAGYTHEESLDIAYCSQFTDCCSRTLLSKIGGPLSAATTQLQLELMDASTDPIGLQDITRIWAAFHFLPGDLYAEREKKCSRRFLRKYRLICNTNGELLKDTVKLAKGRGLQAAGLAMHILADTWAHRYFAGTPSLAINNTNYYFYEYIPDGGGFAKRKVAFNHNPASPDDPDKGIYTNSLYQGDEHSIMNLGHGRAGHFPDYSFARYKYLPAWGGYMEIFKDNPSDYYHAFCQMVYALGCLRAGSEFETDTYAFDEVKPWEDEIKAILEKRQTDACAEWKALAEKISGREVEKFDIEKYQKEYMEAAEAEKDDCFLGQYIIAALEQKSMVTNRIFTSGSTLAGISVDIREKGFRGIKDFRKLAAVYERRRQNDQI